MRTLRWSPSNGCPESSSQLTGSETVSQQGSGGRHITFRLRTAGNGDNGRQVICQIRPPTAVRHNENDRYRSGESSLMRTFRPARHGPVKLTPCSVQSTRFRFAGNTRCYPAELARRTRCTFLLPSLPGFTSLLPLSPPHPVITLVIY